MPPRSVGRTARRLPLAGLDSGALSVDPDIRFPGESDEYRRERNLLLEAEIDLRRAIEEVAAQRRALPPGGVVFEDYRFEEVAEGGGEVRFSDLFSPGKDTLVIYSFMFPRYSDDSRPGPAGGQTARLPLVETPCPSCTSILDSLDGAAPHLAQRLNLAVVAKSAPDRIRAFAKERSWRHLLLSSRDNIYNRNYLAETAEGEQMPLLNVFVRDGERIRHWWGSELLFAPRGRGRGNSPRRLDLAALERARPHAGGSRGRSRLSEPELRVGAAARAPHAVPTGHRLDRGGHDADARSSWNPPALYAGLTAAAGLGGNRG
jgi:predicted dithiol-disulfide oxidoreductase (DUF899 family)